MWRTELKTPSLSVIDFGGASYDDDRDKSTVINTRQYRGPEVTLELEWSFPSDIWCCGCIIAEMLSGELLYVTYIVDFVIHVRNGFTCISFVSATSSFPTHETLEHVAMIEKCSGFFPWAMIKSSPVVRDYFHRYGDDNYLNFQLHH